MSNTISTPPSQPTDLIARFEPARAVCAPASCYRGKRCWVKTAKLYGGGYARCRDCLGCPVFAGNEAKHAAVLRRCMAAQEVTP